MKLTFDCLMCINQYIFHLMFLCLICIFQSYNYRIMLFYYVLFVYKGFFYITYEITEAMYATSQESSSTLL